MQKVIKSVDTRNNGSLGTIEISVFESVQEAVDFYGEAAVLGVLNTAVASESSRIARAAFSKEGSDPQALVDAYRFGVRATKPTNKNFMVLCSELAEAGNTEVLAEAIKLNSTEGVEAAYNYAVENR